MTHSVWFTSAGMLQREYHAQNKYSTVHASSLAFSLIVCFYVVVVRFGFSTVVHEAGKV